MEIIKDKNDNTLTINLVGELDTLTSPQLEEETTDLDGVEILIFDFKDLKYISSAGLRILLKLAKIMKQKGSMIIKNVNEDIKEIFSITGFIDFLNIE